MTEKSDLFDRAHRIVIKVGSAILIGPDNSVRSAWLSSLANDIADLCEKGKQVIVVSSGAVALGRKTLGFDGRALDLHEKQAAAACGQITLCAKWANAFQFEDRQPLYPAQVLLTLDDSENRRRYLNARNTFETLLSKSNIIPVVNENDTVATAEIRVGDNDRLAARVAQMISADLLVLLSDVQGLFDADPTIDKTASLMPVVSEITAEIESAAGGVRSAVGSGGMQTKIEAAKIATAAGCHMLIAYGIEPHPIQSLIKGGECSWFKAKINPQSARKHWISGILKSKGSYIVDSGAVAALSSGKSLLPAGVRLVEGKFERGDAVMIETSDGKKVGKGLTDYSSADAVKIIGTRSNQIEAILGMKYGDTLVHRDNMVLEINGGNNAS
jgi:glutamate 5-kinase